MDLKNQKSSLFLHKSLFYATSFYTCLNTHFTDILIKYAIFLHYFFCMSFFLYLFLYLFFIFYTAPMDDSSMFNCKNGFFLFFILCIRFRQKLKLTMLVIGSICLQHFEIGPVSANGSYRTSAGRCLS